MADIDLDQLIGEIYEAALDRERWPGVLEHIGDALGGAGSLLGIQKFSGGISWRAASRIDLNSIANSWEYLHHPENNPVVRAFPRLPVGEPVTIEAFCHPTPVVRTELYELFFRPLNMLHGVLVPLIKSQEFAAPIAFVRSARCGPFGEEDIALLRRLVPHLQRALRIDQTLAASKARLDGFETLLDGLSTAVLLLDHAARPLHANAAAEKLLGQNDGLGVCCGRLAVGPPNSQAAFARMLDAAARNTLNDCPHAVISIARPSGRRPYAALAAPFPRASEWAAWPGAAPAILLFVSDPEQVPRPKDELLRILYGLTPMESRLAALLAAGHELSEAAELLRISLNTAKTHLKEVFAKTGVRRQTELVRLMVSSLGGVALSDAVPAR